jgi:hypothetical protein
MLAVASYVWRPCFVYRYVLYSSLPLSILLGGAFPAMRARSAKVCLGGLLALCALHQAAAVTAGPFRPDWQSVSRYLEAHATADDRVVVMQDINRWAFEFNTTLPRAQIQCAPVWSAVCGPVVEAHHQGRAAWVIVWLWSDPGNVEACFTKNAYPCTVQDFAGWPRLRLYYVPAEAQGT